MQKEIIVASSNVKKKILKEIKGIHDFSFLTVSELYRGLYGYVKSEGLTYMHKKFHFSYPQAREISKYLPFLDENKKYNDIKLNSLVSVKKELIKVKLYQIDEIFINKIKNSNITFINPLLSVELKRTIEILKKIANVNIKQDENVKFSQKVYYSYPDKETEVYELFLDIEEKLKITDLSHIFLVNVDESYYPILKRMGASFNINVNIPDTMSILVEEEVQLVLEKIKQNLPIEEIFKDTSNDIKEFIVKIINKYSIDLNNLKDEYELFLESFRNKKYETKLYDKAVNLVTLSSNFTDLDYVYLLNFNNDFPKKCKDEDYLSDESKILLGISTSYEINNLRKNQILREIESIKNLKISFKELDGASIQLISELAFALELKNIPYSNRRLGFSEIEDNLYLGSLLDNYNKFGVDHTDLHKYQLSKLRYQEFDSKFKKFSNEFLEKHPLDRDINMSYSNIKLYFGCPFSYYLDRILGLIKFETTLATNIGSYAHQILEDSYNKDFDFDKEIASGKEKLTKKEQFFASLMDKVLKDVLEFNHEFESKMELNDVYRERKINVSLPNINFYGFIDKILYKIIDDTLYLAIFDYKTGSDIIKLNNIIDGQNLQLPSYLYLVNNDEEFKKYKIKVIGLYLQKVTTTLINSALEEKAARWNNFKLQGYSTSNWNELELLDPNFKASEYIKSMTVTKDGNFSKYAKVYNEKQIEEILDIMPKLLEKLREAIRNFDFPIAPVRINGENESCKFCAYKRICFKKENMYNDVSFKAFEDLGGEENGMD